MKLIFDFQKILSLNGNLERSRSDEFTEDNRDNQEKEVTEKNSNLVYELCGTLKELEDVDREVRHQFKVQ